MVTDTAMATPSHPHAGDTRPGDLTIIETADLSLTRQGALLSLNCATYRGMHVRHTPALPIWDTPEDRQHVAEQLRMLADALEFGGTR